MTHYRILIIEDEIPAQILLKKAIEKEFDDMEIIGCEDSVKGAVKWLSTPDNQADIIFMDVELSDGMCFDIFAQTPVKGNVIITTAYDNYAIKAFRMNCIDYLLKPIDHSELKEAVDKCRNRLNSKVEKEMWDIAQLRKILQGERTDYKQRFIVKFGVHITVVESDQIAYFFAENKSTYLVTTDNHHYILDNSLDTVSEQVDPVQFFRISRNCTVSLSSIKDISKHFSNRLKLHLDPDPEFDVFVSRSRTADFMTWLEGD